MREVKTDVDGYGRDAEGMKGSDEERRADKVRGKELVGELEM